MSNSTVMSNDTVSLDVLQWFTPLNGLKPENLNALAKKTQVKRLTAGKLIFRENDREKLTFYLVSGSLELSDKEGNKKILESGTDEARAPITPILPRRYNAKAINEVEFMAIDTDLIDVMLTWDQTGDYEVSELQDTFEMTTADWMTSMLGTKAFHRIPASNIQAIFMRMQQVNFNAGDVVVQQGDTGDFFYVITKGRCSVTRETPLNPDGIKLAELKPGDTFGEESLISDALRNATISMMTDGAVMRLGKDDFKTLLNEPMVDWVEYEEAKKIIEDGGQWLDVRLPSEFEKFHEPGAINIPLYFIRLKLSTLDKNTTYVLCCDTGRRSSAGTFIMSERGFNTRVLKGGLNSDQPGLE